MTLSKAMFKEIIDKNNLHEFIMDFYMRYKIEPCVGFLAGIFKTTPRTISYKIKQLSEEGKVELKKKNKYIVGYKLIV